MVFIMIMEVYLHVLQPHPPVSVDFVSRYHPPLAPNWLDQVHPAHFLPWGLEFILHVRLKLVIRLSLVLEYVGVFASIHWGEVRGLVRELQYPQRTYLLIVLAAIVQRVCFPQYIVHVKAGSSHLTIPPFTHGREFSECLCWYESVSIDDQVVWVEVFIVHIDGIKELLVIENELFGTVK